MVWIYNVSLNVNSEINSENVSIPLPSDSNCCPLYWSKLEWWYWHYLSLLPPNKFSFFLAFVCVSVTGGWRNWYYWLVSTLALTKSNRTHLGPFVWIHLTPPGCTRLSKSSMSPDLVSLSFFEQCICAWTSTFLITLIKIAFWIMIKIVK